MTELSGKTAIVTGGAGSLGGGEKCGIGLDALRAPVFLPGGAAMQIGRAHIGGAALRAAVLAGALPLSCW